jgi:ectoine hydroxylase-related dioxygenase (phytanoyl-CoA dioxygenase family)
MNRFDFGGVSTEGLAQSKLIEAAFEGFTRHGYVILDNVVPPETIRSLHAEFLRDYKDQIRDKEADDSLEVGARRFMIPLRFSGGLGAPGIFGNPYVLALVRMILDGEAIIDAFGAILSLSGAEDQHIHHDGPILFSSEIARLLPAYALTFALPLIEMNDRSGTTAIWPGSHRRGKHEDQEPLRPVIPVGSCMLWDYRTFHSGTPNRSDQVRPMVYATYARRWYQDPVNFRKETLQRLVFEPDFLTNLPDDLRPLFAHVRSAG